MDIKNHVQLAGVALCQAVDHLLEGVHCWVFECAWVQPTPVKILAKEIPASVSQENTVGVDNGDYLKTTYHIKSHIIFFEIYEDRFYKRKLGVCTPEVGQYIEKY